jgi:hypothetical protein
MTEKAPYTSFSDFYERINFFDDREASIGFPKCFRQILSLREDRCRHDLQRFYGSIEEAKRFCIAPRRTRRQENREQPDKDTHR